jgi:hypothetical protein
MTRSQSRRLAVSGDREYAEPVSPSPGVRVSQTAESSTSALAASRELFETVLRSLHDGIVVHNAVGEDSAT